MRETAETTFSRGSNLIIHIGAILVVAAWGASFVMTKVLLENGLGPAECYAYRVVLAYVLMLLISHNRLLSRSWRDEVVFMIIGMCGGTIYFLAENAALEYTLVTNVSLITTTAPLLTAMLVGFVYKAERPTRNMLIGSMIALVGVGMVIFNSSVNLQVNPLGDFLALAASLSWAVYSIVLRRVNATYDVMFITRKMFFYSLLTTVPFMFLKGEPLSLEPLKAPVVWINLVVLGVVCSVLGFIIWNQAIKRIGAVMASNYLYFQPVVTLIVSVIVLGEVITATGYIGCGLILLGVFASDYLDRPRRGR